MKRHRALFDLLATDGANDLVMAGSGQGVAGSGMVKQESNLRQSVIFQVNVQVLLGYKFLSTVWLPKICQTRCDQ